MGYLLRKDDTRHTKNHAGGTIQCSGPKYLQSTSDHTVYTNLEKDYWTEFNSNGKVKWTYPRVLE